MARANLVGGGARTLSGRNIALAFLDVLKRDFVIRRLRGLGFLVLDPRVED